ncbi:putative nuclease HARBI1 [Dreissena polymorpha]|uniref:putative nuclease HARBI1 isoform X1 n=1 Tax=Dreissena polymorpha TaxID=45954 RepID=UPI002264AE5C|nr:putative nuclease HARBI1 isoform X1 [Dreissena polymorpha]XP_052237753.1 putative nuclease HARBI1 [Dreissena polymorpha]
MELLQYGLILCTAIELLLITLQFLAKSEFYSEGGMTHGVSRSSVCKSIWQVLKALDRRLNTVVFPTSERELVQVKQKIFGIAGIPNVIGAVDCTHIAMLAPREREDIYVCRKGYHSINVQAVVDANMRFTNIVAKWPGSTHDSVIFDNCSLKDWLVDGSKGWLLGDSGYGLKPYLLTPKLNPMSRAEIAFNLAHSRSRMVVERAFGLLKSRFRCLHKTGGYLQFSPQKIALVVTVCAKLHNLCLSDGFLDIDDIDVEDDDDNVQLPLENPDLNALRARALLIERFH